MGKFFALITVENTKLWKLLSTKIMLVIMVGIAVGYSFLFNYVNKIEADISAKNASASQAQSSSSPSSASGGRINVVVNKSGQQTPVEGGDWKDDYRAQIKAAQKELDHDKKSSSVMDKINVGPLQKDIAEMQYEVDHNLKPEKSAGLWGKNANIWQKMSTSEGETNPNFGALVSLFAAIACSAVVAGEFSGGTMKAMISRPFGRSQILSAKLIVTLLYALLLMVLGMATFFVSMGLISGFGNFGLKEMMWTGGSILYIPSFVKMLVIYGLDFLAVIFYIILAFSLSALFRSRALATGVSIFLLLIGSGIFRILTEFFSWGKFIVFGVTDFSKYIQMGTIVYGTSLLFALVESAIYAAALLFAGYFVFQKRDI